MIKLAEPRKHAHVAVRCQTPPSALFCLLRYTEGNELLYTTLREMRDVLKAYGQDRVIVGEIYADKIVSEEQVLSFYGTSATDTILDMPFNFMLVGHFGGGWGAAPRTCASPERPTHRDAAELRRQLREYYASLQEWAQPNFVFGNHDQQRIASRVGLPVARAAAVLLLTLRGTPTLCVHNPHSRLPRGALRLFRVCLFQKQPVVGGLVDHACSSVGFSPGSSPISKLLAWVSSNYTVGC